MLDRRRFISGASAVAAVVVAGCAESSDDSDPSSDDDGAGDETETGDDEATDGDEYPPGIDEESVDQQQVIETHFDELDGQSATYDFGFTDTSLEMGDEQHAMVEGDSVYHEWYGVEEKVIMTWSDGSDVYSKATDGQRESYFIPLEHPEVSDVRQDRFVEVMVEALEFEFEERTTLPDETPAVVITAEELAGEGGFQWRGVTDVQDVDASATVGTDGIIRSIEVAFTYGSDGDGEMEATYEVSNINETTVEESEWGEEAQANGVAFEVDESETALSFEMVNGDPIATESMLAVVTEVDDAVVTLESELTTGDTFSVSQTETGIDVVMNGEPDDGEVPDFVDLEIIEPDDLLRYQAGYVTA